MTFRTVNPTTGEVTKTFDYISDDELSQVLNTAHSTFENVWRRTSIQDRVAVVKAAAADLRDNVSDHAALLIDEVGKLIGTAEAEVLLSSRILDYYADRAEKFLAPKELTESPGAVVVTEPIGVIIAIEPWNFPYYQLARVVAPQLIAGNVVVVKHAESVPQSALAFGKLFKDAGAPEGVYTNVFATVEQIGTAIEDPRVAGVTVTGSERAGKAVAERAGRSLKKVVAELGGSDPFLVLEDADIEQAVQGAMFGRMFNTGQTCAASKRIIVVGKERGDQFLAAFTAAMESQTPGDPADPQTTLGPLASQQAVDLLDDQVNAAKAAGARVVTGGERVDGPGFYFAPTVLTDIDPANPAYDTEFFGPVASFYTVDSEDEAIKLANGTRFGLGASVFTADLDRGRAVAAQIESGMVFVNQPAWTEPEIPFGGTKGSGFGRELSELGFGEFVNYKLINVVPAGSPPWGPAQG